MARTSLPLRFLLTISLLGAARTAAAREYFASPSGDDSNPGTLEAPFETLERGTSVLGPGDILTLRGGLYARSRTVVMSVSGTATAPITVRAYPGETPVIRRTSADSSILTGASYLVFEDIVFDGNFQAMEGIKVHIVDGQRSDHVRVTRCTFRNHRGSGMLLSPGDFAVIEDSTFTGNGLTRFDHGIYANIGDGMTIRANLVEGNAGYGIHLYAEEGDALSGSGLYGGAGIVVTGNRIAGNGFREGSGGIVVGGEFNGTVIENNLVHGNRDEGIVLDYSSFRPRGTIVRNNTLFGNGAASELPQIRVGLARDTVVANNIADPGATGGLTAGIDAAADGTVFDRNLYSVEDRFWIDGDQHGLPFWRIAVGETNALVADPAFLNAGAADFHLAQASAAIDAGVMTPGRHAERDFDGDPRPQGDGVDIGADEVAAGTNRPAVALAGPDQTVPPGALVSLDGSASYDPEGSPLAYAWGQTGGPEVVLDDRTSPAPRFTAPHEDRIVLVFQLTVSDGSASSAPDLVEVIVDSDGGGGHCGALSPTGGAGGGWALLLVATVVAAGLGATSGVREGARQTCSRDARSVEEGRGAHALAALYDRVANRRTTLTAHGSVEVAGWAFGEDGPVARVVLEDENGRVLAEDASLARRPDVVDSFEKRGRPGVPLETGFHLLGKKLASRGSLATSRLVYHLSAGRTVSVSPGQKNGTPPGSCIIWKAWPRPGR